MVSKILEKAMTEDDKIEIRQKIIFFVGLSILFITAVIFSIFSTASNAAPSLNEKTPSKQQIVIDDTMNELIKAGYVIKTQETRGIITVYVLKKGDEFEGCRIERSIKKQIEKCYIIELVNK